jgi:hypothetical protein
VNIVSRGEWGAARAKSVTALNPSRVTMFVLHHTTGTYAGYGTVRAIQAFHQGPQRGWADVGYNFLVAPSGEVFEGRGWDRVGAHARGHNSASIGVAFIGDGSKPVPDAAKRSVLLLADEADRRFGKLNRVGHRDVGATACPGDLLYVWWSGNPTSGALDFQDARKSIVSPPKAPPAKQEQVSAESISERLRGTPDVRDGWREHMRRSGWLRRR